MIVLDTHVWMWWLNAPERLSDPAARAIEEANEIGVSAISAWEFSLLVARGRVSTDRGAEAWVFDALRQDDRVRSLPLDESIAVRSALLEREGFHRDPADRFIFATARTVGAPLVTRDEQIRAFDPANTVW